MEWDDFRLYLVFSAVAVLIWRIRRPKLPKFDLKKRHVALFGHDFQLLEQLTKQCFFASARVTLLYSSLESKAEVSKLRTLENHADRFAHIKCVEFNPEKAAQSLTDAERHSHGAFDVLIVCSGFSPCGEFTESSVEDIRSVMEKNYLQSVELLRHVGRRMQARGGGRICIVESAPAYFSLPGVCATAAGALAAFAETMRCELPHVQVLLFALSLMDEQRKNYALIGSSISAPDAAKLILSSIKSGRTLCTSNICHRLLSITTEGATTRLSLVSDTLLSSVSVLAGFVYWRLYLPWACPVSSA